MESISSSNAANISFEQIANYVVISQVSSPAESTKQLVLQCFAVLPSERISSAAELQDIIRVLFALPLSEDQIQDAIDSLIHETKLSHAGDNTLVIEQALLSKLQDEVNQAGALETRIKEQWFEELSITCPGLSCEQLWKALRAYLGKAFRRHGMQTLSLLNPTVEMPQEYSESLSNMLEQSVNEYFSASDRADAVTVLSRFMAEVGMHAERSKFIAQLADGAFHFFTLAVDPQVAEELRKNLSTMTLFCDTNFLFGILDLHVHPQVQVSHDLLKAVRANELPIKLRYHEATLKEMNATIYYYGEMLKSRRWSQSLSRAALKSLNLSGIEMKYHQINANNPIDPETFVGRYEHLDILLKDESIDIYRPSSERTMERGLLYAEYEAYLEHRNKEKPYENMDHDVTVLDTVKSLRSNSKNSLDARALMITCDFVLYGFDWELSRVNNELACTVIPNSFWQLIRPYISSDDEFDKSFAETFAIPEFRTMGSSAAKACSRLLGVLATYKDLSEETAVRLLSNRILIDKLRHVDDQRQFERIVESAIANDNQALLEEKAALMKQLKDERESRRQAEARANEAIQEKERADEINRSITSQLEEREHNERIQEINSNHLRNVQDAAVEETGDAKIANGGKREDRINGMPSQESSIAAYQICVSVLLSALLIIVFEVGANIWWKWNWLIEHKQSYAIQGLFDYLIFVVCMISFCRKHRGWILTTVAIITAIVVALLSLLGGMPKS